MSIVTLHVLEGVGYVAIGISAAVAARLRWPKVFADPPEFELVFTGLVILAWPAVLCAAIGIGMVVVPGWLVGRSMKAIQRRVTRRRTHHEIAELERSLGRS